MRARTIILVACGALGLTMGASQAWAVQLTLQGSQEAGSILSGPKIVAPPVSLTTSAKIVSVTCDTDHFTVHRDGAPYFTVDTGYDRGVACWKDLVISAQATQPDAPILDHHVPD